MIGEDLAAALPDLRTHAESLMVEQAAASRLATAGWVERATLPVRRVRPGSTPAVMPPATASEAFVTRSMHLPHTADVRAGDLLTVAGERTLVTTTAHHTHMIEARVGGVWPAAPLSVTVVRPGTRDARGNPIPGTDKTFRVEDVALFAVSSSDPADLSQVVKTTMRAWCLPGTTLLPGDELLPDTPAMPYRYLVKGDPVYSPLGVVADLQRGKVVST